MSHNKNFGQLVMQTRIEGYPVAVCVSNKEPDKHGNRIVKQLVQSYEERKKAFDDSIDLVMQVRYNQSVL